MTSPGGSTSLEERVRRLVQKVNDEGDNAALLKLMSPDVVLHADGNSPLGGTHVGLAEAMGRFPVMFELSEGTLRLEPIEFVVDAHFALFLQRATATRGGKDLDHVMTVVWRFKDGQVVEMWDHFEDVDVWDNFWMEN